MTKTMLRNLLTVLAICSTTGLLTIAATTSYTIPSGSTYGGIYEAGGSTAITITTSGTYYQWTSSTAGLSSGMTVSAATDDVTVDVAGTFRLAVSCSFSGTANSTVTMAIFEEGVDQTNCHAKRKLSAGGDVGNAGLSCLVTSVANDSYTLRFTSDSNGNSVTPSDCNLNATRVGP